MSDLKKRRYVCETNPDHTELTVIAELGGPANGRLNAAFESWLESHAEANKHYTLVEVRGMVLNARERLLRVTIGLN